MVGVNPRSSTASRLLAVAGACAVAFGLTWLLFVRTAPGQWLDGELLPRGEWGGYAQQTVLRGPAMLVLHRFGNPLLLGLLIVATAAVGVLRRRVWSAVAAVAVFAGSVGVAALLKPALVRPELGVASPSTHNSFPSGHVAAAAALALAILLVAPARARWWLAVPATAAVSVIGAATTVVGWHRFSDVIGSLLLVGAVSCLAAAALTLAPEPAAAQAPKEEADNEAINGLLVQAIALTLLIMAVLALAPDAGARLMLATAAVGALTMAVVSVPLWLIRPVVPDPTDQPGATVPSSEWARGGGS
jgi:membrane-associated phospholipid phosphatase